MILRRWKLTIGFAGKTAKPVTDSETGRVAFAESCSKHGCEVSLRLCEVLKPLFLAERKSLLGSREVNDIVSYFKATLFCIWKTDHFISK